MLVGVGALTVGLRDPVVAARAAAPSAIAPLDSESLTALGNPGWFPGPALEGGTTRDMAPSVVRVEGAESGSGVVVRDDGIVLTSAELVGNQPDVEVTFEDGTTATGTNLGTDAVTNVAVIDLPGDGFAPARLVTPDALAAGDTVVCTGIDTDGDFSTVYGQVASPRTQFTPATGDPIDALVEIVPQEGIATELQGRAVVDGQGAVLALTTRFGDGAYYATPIDVAAKVADDMLETGAAQHSWVGIFGDDAPGGGVAIDRIDADGPAAELLQVDDVIVEMDGEQVGDMSTLVGMLQLHHPGDEVDLTYERDGQPVEATVRLAPLPVG